MPSAPPMRSKEMVVVPKLSNLANPYGYCSEGGLRDRRQQNNVTKSPNRSTNWHVLRWLMKERTYHSTSVLRLRQEMQNACTSQQVLSQTSERHW